MSFARSLRIQLRVIGALLIREVITRFGRHNVGFLWLFLEPILFTLGATAIWTLTRNLHGFSRLQIVPVIVTGYSTLLMWRNCSFRGIKAIEANRSLMYHRNVRLLDIFAARMILEVVGVTASFITVMLVLMALGLMNQPYDLALMLGGWFLIAWFSVCLGIILGCLSEYTDIVERLWSPTSYFLLFVSGTFFMVDWVPTGLQRIVLLFPMASAAEMLRGGYFGPIVRVHYALGYSLVVCTLMFIFALFLIRPTRLLVESGR